MRQALALARDEGFGFFAALFARDLASVEAACGDRDEALRFFDTAIETFYRAGNGGSLALTLGYLTMFLDDIERTSIAARIYGASTRYAAINTLPKLPTTVEHLRLVLGETEFSGCVGSGADMEPADAVRYAPSADRDAQPPAEGTFRAGAALSEPRREPTPLRGRLRPWGGPRGR
jgi:hypothetical protein